MAEKERPWVAFRCALLLGPYLFPLLFRLEGFFMKTPAGCTVSASTEGYCAMTLVVVFDSFCCHIAFSPKVN